MCFCLPTPFMTVFSSRRSVFAEFCCEISVFITHDEKEPSYEKIFVGDGGVNYLTVSCVGGDGGECN